jgi:hypothetical protein
VKLGDFGLAEVAAELAEQQADRASLIGQSPSGGFHKRHMVMPSTAPVPPSLHSALCSQHIKSISLYEWHRLVCCAHIAERRYLLRVMVQPGRTVCVVTLHTRQEGC